MKLSYRSLLYVLLATALLVALPAQGAFAAARLTGVETVAGPAGSIALRLDIQGTPPSPSAFFVDDPARLSIDLAGTTLGVDKRYRTIAQGPIQSVSMAETADRSRLVVQLTRRVGYRITRDSQGLLVALGEPRSQATTGTPGGPADAITDIDFRRGQDGAGQITVSFDGQQAPVDIDRQGNQLIARLPGVRLPSRLARRLDVTDFATPVQTVDATTRGGDTELVITPATGADFERLTYQTGNDLVIELQPKAAAASGAPADTKPQYHGQRISLSFQNIDVRSVLQIIADVADVNMVVSDSVSGTIALELDDVPWDQALDIILDAKSLGMQRSDNVITIAPLSEIASRQRARAAAREASRELAPLQSEIIQINYADAADMANILQSNSVTTRRQYTAPTGSNGVLANALAANGTGGSFTDTSTDAQRTASSVVDSDIDQHSLLSPRGHVTIDARTNSLLVTDTAAKLDQIRQLVARLDIPVRQVLIESRIVVANRDFTRSLGVSQTGVDNSRLNNALNGRGENGLAGAYDATSSGYAVGLPATDASSVLSSSIISDTFSLNLQLSAMESENNGEIISSPRIITADGREASIEQGREIPYQSGTSGSLAGASVEFKKAVLGLNVTPKITPDDKVIMNLNVTQDSVGEFVPTSQGGSVPSIDTRSLSTRVLVANGDTVVLGGIFEQNNTHSTGGVPFLRKIPLVGALFSNQNLERQKRELLIFVTPKILDNRLAVDNR